ncbi:MAG: DNA mismatch repair endonuclease MutL [Ruminococcus sp.]|nr:DNA mismatch repair endonuclease MutL [Ruminococcus sp.]
MPAINVLSKEISELIAAGEVIERPSSVVKELVENSIDSGARHITVEIKNGGTTYIRVTDDGCGMAFEDVPKAFLRHATSKIVTKNDLDNIFTLGFRGEALASICAVSRVEIMTKQKNETYGTIYRIEGGTEISHEKSGCPDGTTIMIRDIFYNVPARAKFLKKDVTEANSVSNIVQKITLSHPETAIKMVRDNRVEFNSAGDGELFSAIYAVFGKDFTRDLLPVDHEAGDIKIKGYIVKPLYSKFNRSFQNFFINGRYVKSRLCSAAVENSYENMLMTGRFPACVLMIEMPPSMLDVNIHPAKAEVRFIDEKSVSDAIFFAVKNAFIEGGLLYEFDAKQPRDWSKHDEEVGAIQQEFMFTPISSITEREAEMARQRQRKAELAAAEDKRIQDKLDELERMGVFDGPAEVKAPPQPDGEKTEPVLLPEPAAIAGTAPPAISPTPPVEAVEKQEESVQGFRYITGGSFAEKPEAPEEPEIPEPIRGEKPDIRVIGEAFGLYIIVEHEGRMVMIDKHAAHERIIFEQLKSRNCRQYSQKLLVGVKQLLTSEEIDALENNTELLEDMGFVFDFSEKPYVTATALPTFVMDLNAEEIISEVANNLRMHKQNPQSGALDDMLHTMACKAAIKANDKNSPEEMLALAEQVFADEKIRHCPHGRPVMFTMSKSSIDHQFKRT